MASATYQLIRQAIVAKKNITATYDGYVRYLTPHRIGTKKGIEQALLFQFGGGSQKWLAARRHLALPHPQ